MILLTKTFILTNTIKLTILLVKEYYKIQLHSVIATTDEILALEWFYMNDAEGRPLMRMFDVVS